MIYKYLLCFIFILSNFITAYNKVEGPYKWSFPYDHGVHNDYQVEWWYFTGHLKENNQTNRYFGFELTFFRIGNEFNQPTSTWAFNNIYVTHFTITDENNDQFYEYEWTHRESDPLSIAREGSMMVKNGPFEIIQKNDTFHINAEKEDIKLTLR